MRIINILELVNGVPQQIQSFPIYEEQLVQDVVDEAKKLYIEMIKYHDPNISEEDIEFYLDEESYDNEMGKELFIIWSDINE